MLVADFPEIGSRGIAQVIVMLCTFAIGISALSDSKQKKKTLPASNRDGCQSMGALGRFFPVG